VNGVVRVVANPPGENLLEVIAPADAD